jgi:ATP-dependent Lon protease
MSADFRGDPSSALLEVLDPEQNATFSDHFLDLDYDLSDVMFVCTANSLHGIPLPLQDRMEIIQLPGYTEFEKIAIAERYLIPKQKRDNGIESVTVEMGEDTIRDVIHFYTKEAGVRNLEREIATICRKIARDWVSKRGRPVSAAPSAPVASGALVAGHSTLPAGAPALPTVLTAAASPAVPALDSGPAAEAAVAPTAGTAARAGETWVLTPKRLPRYLGPHRFRHGRSDGNDEIGLVNGLAVTMYGGDLLQTEVSIVAGKGKMVLTGKLGDVMQESAQAAISYVRARAPSLGLERDFYSRADIHVHLPEGAIPKDGPSAGITMCTGLVSALLRVPVRRNVAMTGEITLRGRVLPIGGLKEKILAAHRAGIAVVVMPKSNAKDLRDIPKKVLKSLRVSLVEHMDEVLRIALVLPNPEEFLREPSQPVDWRVQVDRRADRDRREDSRIPVASATPPAIPGTGTGTDTTLPLPALVPALDETPSSGPGGPRPSNESEH